MLSLLTILCTAVKIDSSCLPYVVIVTSVMAAIRSGVTPTCLLKCLLRQTVKPGRGNIPTSDVWNSVGLLNFGTLNSMSVIPEKICGVLRVNLLAAGLASLQGSSGRTLAYDFDSSIVSLQQKRSTFLLRTPSNLFLGF